MAAESPYFHGEADLTGRLPMDEVAGWFIQGLWIEFADLGVHVFNGLDANGISDQTALPGDDGHVRMTDLPPPETS